MKRSVKRRLTANSKRLTSLRAEVEVLTEQLRHLEADADDGEIRAMVADNTAVTREARLAREHADAIRKERDRTATEISELERQQDELLDELGAG